MTKEARKAQDAADHAHAEEALIAAAEQAEKPAPKLVKTQPVKPANTASATAYNGRRYA